VRKAADSLARDRRHGLQQVSGLRVAMQRARDLSDSAGKTRRGSRNCASHFRKQPLGHWRGGLSHHRQEFAGCHSHQREKVLRSLMLGFRFGREFAEVLHHGIGIDLAHGIELVFTELFLMLKLILLFHLFFHFLFTEQAADHIADGAKPAFSFQARLVLHLFFHLLLEFVLVFRMGF
jgi:hypothetical protein